MRLDKTHVRQTLEEFSKYVVKQSRTNLTKGGKNSTKELYNSLGSEINVSKNSFGLDFIMAGHGKFQDQGVRGKTSSSKAPNSPFKFGTGTGKKGGLTEGISKWVVSKRIQFKNKRDGKFMSYESTAYLIRNSVYNKGIKPSFFFTKPFNDGFKRMPNDIIEAYGLDVEQFLKQQLT